MGIPARPNVPYKDEICCIFICWVSFLNPTYNLRYCSGVGIFKISTCYCSDVGIFKNQLATVPMSEYLKYQLATVPLSEYLEYDFVNVPLWEIFKISTSYCSLKIVGKLN